jgi:hypothetical protein
MCGAASASFKCHYFHRVGIDLVLTAAQAALRRPIHFAAACVVLRLLARGQHRAESHMRLGCTCRRESLRLAHGGCSSKSWWLSISATASASRCETSRCESHPMRSAFGVSRFRCVSRTVLGTRAAVVTRLLTQPRYPFIVDQISAGHVVLCAPDERCPKRSAWVPVPKRWSAACTVLIRSFELDLISSTASNHM